MKGKTPTILFSLLAAFVTLSTLMNVLPDNTDVIALAERTVCQGKTTCRFSKTSVMRTPLGQTIQFTDGKTDVEITCRRAAIAFGEYACRSSQAQAP